MSLGHTAASRQLVADGIDKPSTLALGTLNPELRAAVEGYAEAYRRSNRHGATLNDADKARLAPLINAGVKAWLAAFADRELG